MIFLFAKLSKLEKMEHGLKYYKLITLQLKALLKGLLEDN
jgi:hypothetical protein